MSNNNSGVVLYVTSNLDTKYITRYPKDRYANHLTYDNKTYLLLTPCSYVWLRQQTEKANASFKEGKLKEEIWKSIKQKFMYIHNFAMENLSSLFIDKALKNIQKNHFKYPGQLRFIYFPEVDMNDPWPTNHPQDILTSIGKEKPLKSESLADLEYVVIFSELLEDYIILLFKKNLFNVIYKLYPGIGIYFPSEITILSKIKDVNFIKHLHRIKKSFEGFVISGQKIKENTVKT